MPKLPTFSILRAGSPLLWRAGTGAEETMVGA